MGEAFLEGFFIDGSPCVPFKVERLYGMFVKYGDLYIFSCLGSKFLPRTGHEGPEGE